MAVHFSILAREIPRTEEPGGLQSMGSQKSQTNTATSRYIHVAMAAKCTPGNSYFFVKDVLLVNFEIFLEGVACVIINLLKIGLSDLSSLQNPGYREEVGKTESEEKVQNREVLTSKTNNLPQAWQP